MGNAACIYILNFHPADEPRCIPISMPSGSPVATIPPAPPSAFSEEFCRLRKAEPVMGKEDTEYRGESGAAGLQVLLAC